MAIDRNALYMRTHKKVEAEFLLLVRFNFNICTIRLLVSKQSPSHITPVAIFFGQFREEIISWRNLPDPGKAFLKSNDYFSQIPYGNNDKDRSGRIADSLVSNIMSHSCARESLTPPQVEPSTAYCDSEHRERLGDIRNVFDFAQRYVRKQRNLFPRYALFCGSTRCAVCGSSQTIR